MSVEHQELVRSFAGQGRIEPSHDAWAELRTRHGETLPRLEVWDARLAYAAVCWGLSGGEAIHDNGTDWPDFQQGFARCYVRVPDGWSHVGLVGIKDHAGGGWRYPSKPGEVLRTWLHGSEIHLCRSWGWQVRVFERLWFPTSSKPLQTFTDRLVKARTAVPDRALPGAQQVTARLVRAGLRAILLHAIGRLHGRPPVIVRAVPIDQADEVPDDAADVHMRDGEVRWTERAEHAHDPATSHPEWSAAIWARARCRLLDAPAPKGDPERQGALHLRPSSLVALRTDAIWTTDSPTWSDDGRPGRYTRRRRIDHPVPTPSNLAQLLALAGDQ